MPALNRVSLAVLLPAVLGLLPGSPGPVGAQDGDEGSRALAVADSSLAAITRGDMVALTDLKLPEAFVVAVGGEWSHCGLDTFTLLEVGDAWRIASLAYTVEQPPACRAHPDGPPGA